MNARVFRQEAEKPVGRTPASETLWAIGELLLFRHVLASVTKRGVLMAQTKLNVVEDTIENQIAELRSQISSLSKSVSARAEGVGEDASEFLDEARGRVRKAASNVRAQGQNVVEAVKENPGTATSLLTIVGALGFAIGYAVGAGTQQSSSNSSLYRWR